MSFVEQTLTFRRAVFRLDDYIPDSLRSTYDNYKASLLAILTRTGIISPPADPSVHSDRPELSRARTSHSSAVDILSGTTTKLSNAQAALSKDWGPAWEWKKLDNTCVEFDQGEYVYEVCFFGAAQQKAKNGGKTSLGRFAGWATDRERGEEGYWLKQRYEGGQRCWNGPARSAKVDLFCSTKNELVSVIEPEKVSLRCFALTACRESR